MGVLRSMGGPLVGHNTLTTRFVHDWRAKPGAGLDKKQWLRRSRMVAREYALERNDEVYSPASRGQTLRFLPFIYLMKKQEEEVGGDKHWLGSLDVKDAFLQVDQAVPTQLRTSSGAKAWLECVATWLEEHGFALPTWVAEILFSTWSPPSFLTLFRSGFVTSKLCVCFSTIGFIFFASGCGLLSTCTFFRRAGLSVDGIVRLEGPARLFSTSIKGVGVDIGITSANAGSSPLKLTPLSSRILFSSSSTGFS